MKNAFFSRAGKPVFHTLNISVISIAFCLMTTACGSQKYYMPGGGRHSSSDCGCPAFSAVTPTSVPTCTRMDLALSSQLPAK